MSGTPSTPGPAGLAARAGAPRPAAAPLVAAGLVAWLLAAAVTLAVQPIAPSEADLVFEAGGPSAHHAASPLGMAALRLVGLVGPGAGVALRLLGLAGLGLLALAAFRLCSGGRAGLLAAATVGSAGALLVGAVQLAPAAWLLGAEALLLLAVLALGREEPGRPPGFRAGALRLAAALAAALVVALEPAALVLVGAGALWLASAPGRRGAAALTAGAGLAVLAGLRAGGLAPALWPAADLQRLPPRLAGQLLGLGLGDGFAAPAHPILVLGAPAVGLALAGLALVGALGSRPREPWPLGLGLLLTALAVVVLRGPDGLRGGTGFLVLPPLLVFGALAVDRLRPGPDRAFWLLLLVGLSAGSGLRALASYRHEETRAAAAALGPAERPTTPHEGLRRAVELYRPRAAAEPGASRVRVHRPGDRSPRAVAVRAFGERLGRLWLVRPGAPVHDLGQQLEGARVRYLERGLERPCPWQAARTRFFCGGPEYQHVAPSSALFDGAPAEAIYAHPLDDGVLEIAYRDIPLGRRLVGVAGLDDGSIEFSTAEVDLEVEVTGRPPLRIRVGRRRGLQSFEVPTAGGPAVGEVVLRITAEDDRARHLFWDALTVDR